MSKNMGKGVSDRQMRRQASHIDERQASREDKIIREAANAFAKQLQSAASIDYKDYNDPKNFGEAWHDFEEFFSASATSEKSRGRRASLSTGTGSSRKRLGAFLLALTVLELVTSTSANIFQRNFENDSLGSIGSDGPERHGNLRGTVGDKSERSDGYAVATARTMPAPVAMPATPAMPPVPRDSLGEMGRVDTFPSKRRTREESAKRRVQSYTDEELTQREGFKVTLGKKVNEFRRKRPSEKIPIATLAKEAGFRTYNEEGSDYYSDMVNLGFVSFDDMDLRNADFKDTGLSDASFNRCSLVKANFRGATLFDNKFNRCDLSQANLSSNEEDSYASIYLTDSNCNGATFEGLGGEVLVGSTPIGGSDFRGTNWKNTDITLLVTNVANSYPQSLPDDAEHRPDFEGASWDGAKLTCEMSFSSRPNALARNLHFDKASQVTSVTYPKGLSYYGRMGAWGDGMEETTHPLNGERVIHDDALTSGAIVVGASSGNETGLIGLKSDPALCESIESVPSTTFDSSTGRDIAGSHTLHPSGISQPQLGAFAGALSKLFEKLEVNADIINLDALKSELANSATTPERAAEINKVLEHFTKELGSDETLTDIENICGGGGGRDPLYLAPAVFPAEPGAVSTLVVSDDVKKFFRTFFARIGFTSDRLDKVIDNGDAQRVLQAIYGKREKGEESATATGAGPGAGPSAETPSSSGTNIGAIAGGIAGGVVLMMICCYAACCRGNDQNRRRQPDGVGAGDAAANPAAPGTTVAGTAAHVVAGPNNPLTIV